MTTRNTEPIVYSAIARHTFCMRLVATLDMMSKLLYKMFCF